MMFSHKLLIALAALSSTALAFQVPSSPSPQQKVQTTKTALSGASYGAPLNKPSVSSNADLKIKAGEVVLEPNYDIAAGVLLAGPLLLFAHTGLSADGTTSALAWAGFAVHSILGYYIKTQTDRVRCVFDKTNSFEFKNIQGDHLVTKPNLNYVKGTINRWKCDSTVDFGYLPNKVFPMITWFKETDTPANTYGMYGFWGKVFSGVNQKGKASIHFFPGFIDIPKFEDEMLARGATKKNPQ